MSVLLIKSTALVGTLITGDAVHVGMGCVGGGGCKSLCFLFNFALNLKLL